MSTNVLENTQGRFRSGLRYRPLGKFFESALRRRTISISVAASTTGLSEKVLHELIAGERKFEPEVVKRLKPLFPTMHRSFLKWQDEINRMDENKTLTTPPTGRSSVILKKPHM